MKRMVFKSENLLVDVLGETEVAGVKRIRIRDASNKKAEVRTVLEFALREATDADLDHIVYMYTDDETGETHSLKLQKEFIAAIPKNLGCGDMAARTTRSVLEWMEKADTDGNRRQFRAAVAYWIERGLVICSTSNGYFIALSEYEVDSCVKNKERQARANLRRAELLRGMDVDKSITLFMQQITQSSPVVPAAV